MNKKEAKKFNSINPGGGYKVIDGDLGYCLRLLKSDLRESKKILKVYEDKEYKKPSVARREQLERAKFKQRKESGK